MQNSKKGNSLKDTLYKSGIYMFLRVLAFLFAYVFALLVVKVYDENTYGFVTLSFTIMVVTSTITLLGFDINLTKHFAQEDSINNHASKFYTSFLVTFFLSATIASLIFIFREEISEHFFNKPQFAEYLKWTAFSIPVWALLTMTSAVFRGFQNITYFSIFNSFGRFGLVLLFLCICLFYFEPLVDSPELPIILHLCAISVLLIVAFSLLSIKLKKVRVEFNGSYKSYFKDSLPIFYSATLIILLTWIDKFLLGVFVDEALVGIYDIAIRISALIVFSLDAINSILTPKISSAFYQDNLKQMQKEIDVVSKINLGISILVFLVILLFNGYIFNLFGKSFIVGQLVLYIVCIAQLINSFTGPVWNIMQMTGQQRLLSKILGVTLLLNLILNLILIPKFGIEGAAIATGTSLILWNSIASFWIYKKLGIRTFYLPKL